MEKFTGKRCCFTQNLDAELLDLLWSPVLVLHDKVKYALLDHTRSQISPLDVKESSSQRSASILTLLDPRNQTEEVLNIWTNHHETPQFRETSVRTEAWIQNQQEVFSFFSTSKPHWFFHHKRREYDSIWSRFSVYSVASSRRSGLSEKLTLFDSFFSSLWRPQTYFSQIHLSGHIKAKLLHTVIGGFGGTAQSNNNNN